MILGIGNNGQRVLPLRDPTPSSPRRTIGVVGSGRRGGPRSASPAGLTLIELLVSVAILAGATVLIMQAFAKGAYTLAVAGNRLRAYSFVSNKMAELEVAFNEGTIPKTEGQFRVGRDEFRWHLDSEATSEDSTLELVTLNVEWAQSRRPYATHISLLRRQLEGTP